MACGMACAPPRQVTSGYFRVHLYVVLGLNTLAAMVAMTVPELAVWPAVIGATLSYLGSVIWLYNCPRAGRVALLAVALTAVLGAWQAIGLGPNGALAAHWLNYLAPVTGGWLLGITMAAMLLGHWYLNTPTMQLAPLQRLVLLIALAVVLRAIVSAWGFGLTWSTVGPLATHTVTFLALRWLSGILGVALLTWMTWQTLKVPNTQSATGILYVAVIATFLGELTAQLLSAGSAFPL